MAYQILVTGGAGYLGSTMVPDLLAAGHYVTVVDNFMFGQASLNHVCYHPNFSVVKGDIRIASVMAPLIKKADIIIPLAALVGAPMCNQDPVGATTTNHDAIAMMMSPMALVVRTIIAPKYLRCAQYPNMLSKRLKLNRCLCIMKMLSASDLLQFLVCHHVCELIFWLMILFIVLFMTDVLCCLKGNSKETIFMSVTFLAYFSTLSITLI